MFKRNLFICELASLEFLTDFLRMIRFFSDDNFKCGKTKRNMHYTPNTVLLCVKEHSSPPPPSQHTHILRNAHILLLLCLSQVWNSLEKYDKWNSHTLGTLFSHSLALSKSGQRSSLSSCWAVDGLRVSGEVKPELLPVRTLQSFFILLLWAGNCEEALCKLGTGLQGSVCE